MALRLGTSRTVKNQAKRADTVAAESTEFLRMQELGMWDLLRDLWDGTQAMRDAGEKWLPRNEAEEPTQYSERVKRSFLFNGFRNAIEQSVSEPMSEPIIIEGLDDSSLPDEIKDLSKDVDDGDTNLHEFVKDWFESAEKYGLSHALIDFPAMKKRDEEDDDEDRTETLEEERERKPRPIWMIVTPPQLIGSRFEKRQLSQIRIRETRIVEEGTYLDKEEVVIRVYNRTTWEVWVKDDDKSTENGKEVFELEDAGPNTLGKIPLVSFFTNKLSGMTGISPFLNLAWLNLAHWQSSSDQRNILRIARIANLVQTGVSNKEKKQKTLVGADAIHKFTSENAKMFFAEIKGLAIGAGQSDLDKLEEQMTIMGKQPQLIKSPNVTATEKTINTNKASNVLQNWATDMETSVESAYILSMEWMGIKEPPKDFRVRIHKDFTLAMTTDNDLEHVEKAREFGDIDQETYLGELKKRKTIDQESEIKKIIEKTNQEKKEKLDALGIFDGDPDLSNDDDDDVTVNNNGDAEGTQ